VIFDFDGLILDTETPEFIAWQEAYSALGASLDRQTWAQVIGTLESGWDPWTYLEEQVGHPVDRGPIRAVRQTRHLALIDAEVARPGVRAWLDQARDLGLRVGLASSSSAEWVTTYLKRLGILDRFSAIATGDRVPHSKPDPAVYRLALSELGGCDRRRGLAQRHRRRQGRRPGRRRGAERDDRRPRPLRGRSGPRVAGGQVDPRRRARDDIMKPCRPD